MERPIPILLSVPTSGNGATAAATFAYFTNDYRPPRQARFTSADWNKNHNGLHKYNNDNGPGPYTWSPFNLMLADDISRDLPSPTQMWANLQFLWNYIEGPLQMGTPDGVYLVDWPEGFQLERQFLTQKGAAGDKQRSEYRVTVSFEEG